MNTKRVWILCLFLAVTLGAVYFLPKVGAVAQSAVNMKLPDYRGAWTFNRLAVTRDEIEILSPDTEFSKARCEDFAGSPYEDIDLSLVLSGADINNSIHRPERCMPAQGHNIVQTDAMTIKLANGREIPVRRLVSVKTETEDPVEGAPEKKEGLRKETYDCLTYYFFVGHDRVSSEHLQRTLWDIEDRLVRGMDQRWAYVTASTLYGKLPGVYHEVTREEADARLQGFLAEFAGAQINWAQIQP